MKFDIFAWSEAKNGKIEKIRGRLLLQCSAPCALYAQAEGVETLVGYGATFDVETPETVTYRIDGPKTVRAFYRQPERAIYRPEGEVYTNIDRMPDESGSMAEVLRARRQLEIERRALLREIRQARAETVAAVRRAAPQPQPELAPQGEAEPDAQAASDGEATA